MKNVSGNLMILLLFIGIYEDLLKEKCKIPTLGPYCFDSLLDTCALNIPKVALISTLTSVSPAQPYIFRNYEYSSRSGDINRLGSSSHEIWQAVRASSGESLVPLLLVMQ